MNVARRATAILANPFAEWGVIRDEAGDPAFVLSRYVAVLAVIPSLSGFIGTSLIGVTVPGTGVVRVPLLDGMFGAVFAYVTACGTVLVLAAIIDLFAPLFGGARSFNSAFKLAVYSFTPVWIAGLFLLLPGLHFLLLCGFYGTYILWLGLPRLMKVPEPLTLTFAVTIAACACLLVVIAAQAQRMIFGIPGL